MTESTNLNNHSYNRTREEKLQKISEGRVWEEKLKKILEKKLPKHIKVVDTADTMCDADRRSYPDIMIVDTREHKNVYYDAKRKTFYWDKNNNRSVFTLDANKTESYRAIAEKTASKVYVAVWDDKKDKNHYYLMDITTPETDRHMYDNKYNTDGKPAYRWDKNLFKKLEIEEEVEFEHYLT